MNERTPNSYDESDVYDVRSEIEATAFVPEMRGGRDDSSDLHDVPPLPDRPPPMPADPLDRPHTREHLALSAMGEIDQSTPAPHTANKRIRQPAPRRKRPTLLPPNSAMPPPPSRRNSNVMQPVRPRQDLARPNLGGSLRESSDVVQTFDSGAAEARPRPIQAKTGPKRPSRLELRRKAVAARRQPQPRRQLRPAPQMAPAQAAYATLPISAEALAMLIADQRRRLHVLDGFARGLEIGAGVLGTLSLAVLIAALVSIMVGQDVSVLNASTALVGSGAALGLTLLMVVASVALRQLAHISAQIAALLESLTDRR